MALPRLAFLVVLLLALCLAACGDDREGGEGAKGAEAKKGSGAKPGAGIKPLPYGRSVELPAGAVAVVGDDVITRKEYDQMADAYARDGFRTISIAHSLRKCETYVANMFLPPEERDRRFSNEPPDAECVRRYEALKNMQNGPRAMKEMQNGPPAMRMLLQAVWLEREAKKQGVSATLADGRRALRKKLKPNYPTREHYNSLLQSLEPYERRLAFAFSRMMVQQERVQAKRKRAQRPLSEQDVKRHYRENAKRYRIPERRTIEYIRVDKQADAGKAERALRGGKKFKAVARRLSSVIAPDCCSLSITADGSSSSVDDSQTLQEAALAAKKGRLMGPLGTPSGWYVFKVVDIDPPSRQALSIVRGEILKTLRQRREVEFQPKFVRHMHREYREITKCAPKLAIPMCSNGSAPELQ